MEELQTGQEEELTTVNWSIFFLILLIAGVLLSFAATVEQREGLVRALCCKQEDTTNVFCKRWAASALIVGTTGFFTWLACRSAQDARQQGDCRQQRSAQTNLLASILVFVAALLRLNELKLTAREAS